MMRIFIPSFNHVFGQPHSGLSQTDPYLDVHDPLGLTWSGWMILPSRWVLSRGYLRAARNVDPAGVLIRFTTDPRHDSLGLWTKAAKYEYDAPTMSSMLQI